MINMINGIKINILKNKGLITIISLALFLLIPSIIIPPSMEAFKKNNVLKVTPKIESQIPIPSVTIIPATTTSLPIITTTLTVSTTTTTTTISSITPTVTPTPVQQTANTLAPTSTPIPTPTSIPTITPTATPTPTPQGLKIQIEIDYAGQKPTDTYIISGTSGKSAWDAVVLAVGMSNLQFTDYGDMGFFITGFNGINAASNQYFEFRVNGVSSNVGVSSYICNSGDKLDFILTNF